MPKYRFVCGCGAEIVKYVSASALSVPCTTCSNAMHRQIPASVEPASVKELVDSYVGARLPADNKEILESRRSEHFWRVEVPRLVGEYPIEHSLQEGWLYVDEQGKLQVQTKPPHRR